MLENPSFLISSLLVKLSQVTLTNYFCLLIPNISNLIASNGLKSHELLKISTNWGCMIMCLLNTNFC